MDKPSISNERVVELLSHLPVQVRILRDAELPTKEDKHGRVIYPPMASVELGVYRQPENIEADFVDWVHKHTQDYEVFATRGIKIDPVERPCFAEHHVEGVAYMVTFVACIFSYEDD